jgi:hypothetical protein
MQIISANLALDREVGCIEPGARRDTPIAVNPSAVDANTKCLRQQTKKGPAVAVIDDIPTFAGMLQVWKVRNYRFISNGGIIERERTGKYLFPAMPWASAEWA